MKMMILSHVTLLIPDAFRHVFINKLNSGLVKFVHGRNSILLQFYLIDKLYRQEISKSILEIVLSKFDNMLSCLHSLI